MAHNRVSRKPEVGTRATRLSPLSSTSDSGEGEMHVSWRQSWLLWALVLLGGAAPTAHAADTRVGYGECTFDGATVRTTSASLGSERERRQQTYEVGAFVTAEIAELLCRRAWGEQLVAYEKRATEVRCHLITPNAHMRGNVPPGSAKTAPNGVTGSTTYECWRADQSVHMQSTDRTQLLRHVGSVPVRTQANVDQYLRPTAHKTWTAAERGLGVGTSCDVVATRATSGFAANVWAVPRSCHTAWRALGLWGDGTIDALYEADETAAGFTVAMATYVTPTGKRYHGAMRFTSSERAVPGDGWSVMSANGVYASGTWYPPTTQSDEAFNHRHINVAFETGGSIVFVPIPSSDETNPRVTDGRAPTIGASPTECAEWILAQSWI
ncbi:MAG: hypothetical protein ACKVI4_16800, partial [Actinomycetales bacterium]